MQNKLMMFLLSHMYEGIKVGFICVLAFFAGGLTEIVDTANAHPAITSVLAGGFIAVGVRFVDKWLEGRNKNIKTADKVLELEHAEKKELREAHAKLIAEKEAWWKLQLDRVNADLFSVRQKARTERMEASQINHKAINELMRLQNLILGMQRTLVMNNLDVPKEAYIDLTRFMLPVWEDEKDDQHETADTTMDG